MPVIFHHARQYHQLASEEVLKLLKDPAKWDQAREALKSPPLAPADFKTCFRTYSDADPEQHLAFDLYRIQAQEALKVIVVATILYTMAMNLITMIMTIIVILSIASGFLFCLSHVLLTCTVRNIGKLAVHHHNVICHYRS